MSIGRTEFGSGLRVLTERLRETTARLGK